MKATTKLEAVNRMLATLGEAPINSLAGTQTADVGIALATLEEISKDVQSEGWNFNTEDGYSLTPNESGTIAVPANILSLRLSREYHENVAVFREGKLYNKVEHTYQWDKAVKADVIFGFDFEEIPEVARRYIMIRAARVFQDRSVGSDTLHAFTLRDESLARIRLEQEESHNAGYSVLSDSIIREVTGR